MKKCFESKKRCDIGFITDKINTNWAWTVKPIHNTIQQADKKVCYLR